MKKIVLISIAALALAGCNQSATELKAQRDEIQQKLPRGCVFKDLGSYNNMRVNAVICADGVTTTNFRYGCGKNCTRNETTVAFGRPD